MRDTYQALISGCRSCGRPAEDEIAEVVTMEKREKRTAFFHQKKASILTHNQAGTSSQEGYSSGSQQSQEKCIEVQL
jgi:hypothetical protein